MRHLKIHLFGSVQGVFFRAHAKELAEQLHIFGFVRNEKDGSVYLEAEGTDEHLKAFVEWCRVGPPKAKVERLESVEGDLEGYADFSIQHEE
jgi:acylphosphatase